MNGEAFSFSTSSTYRSIAFVFLSSLWLLTQVQYVLFCAMNSDEAHHALPQPLIIGRLDGVHFQLIEVSSQLVFHLQLRNSIIRIVTADILLAFQNP